jgi:hypothetical protein
LTEACSLHRTFIGLAEHGERNVAILILRRIANSLQVSVAELFAVTKSKKRAATAERQAPQQRD